MLNMYDCKKTFKTVTIIGVSVVLLDSCAGDRVRRDRLYHAHSKYTTHQDGSRISRSFNSQVNLSKKVPINAARSFQEIDRQAVRTKPVYIASQPMQIPKDVRFVNLNTYRYVMLNIINSTRASALGTTLSPQAQVEWNIYLAKAAEAHARDLAIHRYISHLGSGDRSDYARKAPGVGSNFYERIIFYGYPAKPNRLSGEILAVTKDRIVGTKEVMPHFKHAIENFLKSPKHQYILTNPRLNRVGIAAYRSGSSIFWVVEFVEEK